MSYFTDEDHKHLVDALHRGTARAQRALNFSNMVQHLMRDFTPQSREVNRVMSDYLVMTAFKHNLQIVNVPPEMDEFDKLAIERAMLDNRVKQLFPEARRDGEQPSLTDDE